MTTHVFEPQNMFAFVESTTSGGNVITITTASTTGTGVTTGPADPVDWAVASTWEATASTAGLSVVTTTAETNSVALPVAFEWEGILNGRYNAAEQERREKASERAKTLLKRHLTPKQWIDYEELGHFYVKTPKGHLYQIGSANCQNVVRLNKRRKPMRVLCVVIRDEDCPVEDLMLAQKLMLETQEDAFLGLAHHWGVQSARGIRQAA